MFCDTDNLHSALPPQHRFIDDTVLPVPGKTVELMNQDHRKRRRTFLRRCNHGHKGGTRFRPAARDASVNVHMLRRNRQLVLPGIVFQRPVLRLWRIFRLILRGHADITCGFLPCFHTAPPLCFKTYVKTQERIPLSMHNVLAER